MIYCEPLLSRQQVLATIMFFPLSCCNSAFEPLFWKKNTVLICMTAHLLSAIEAAAKIMNYVCLTEVNQMIRFSVIFLHEGGMHAFHAA